ncbi:hypothetical protein NDU88_001933 [Pleurodeles waltl]|uniref:Uncharacterized protein n=1 Tax=Pleurodeles waltl TaxID=8319 RepID=A0AAV7TL67_PLEWA|nr:hypothetical protein NDU88_001933 [Pleurodeles waltl]
MRGERLADRVPHLTCGRRARYVLGAGSSVTRSCCSGSRWTAVADCQCRSLIGGSSGADRAFLVAAPPLFPRVFPSRGCLSSVYRGRRLRE